MFYNMVTRMKVVKINYLVHTCILTFNATKIIIEKLKVKRKDNIN